MLLLNVHNIGVHPQPKFKIVEEQVMRRHKALQLAVLYGRARSKANLAIIALETWLPEDVAKQVATLCMNTKIKPL